MDLKFHNPLSTQMKGSQGLGKMICLSKLCNTLHIPQNGPEDTPFTKALRNTLGKEG